MALREALRFRARRPRAAAASSTATGSTGEEGTGCGALSRERRVELWVRPRSASARLRRREAGVSGPGRLPPHPRPGEQRLAGGRLSTGKPHVKRGDGYSQRMKEEEKWSGALKVSSLKLKKLETG
ncbi:uncharacterized protein RHO17_021890 [Thomomys bottae]